jgi:hypothetical protein
MAQPESLQTMLQGAFVLIDNATKSYGLKVSGLTAGEGGVPLETAIAFVARATSIRNSGEASAPGAAGLIAATPALDQGTWEIEITSTIGGTTVAALESFNMEVLNNGVGYARVINPVPGTTGCVGPGYLKYRYDGAGVIRVQANEAATAGSYYAATIVCTRIN